MTEILNQNASTNTIISNSLNFVQNAMSLGTDINKKFLLGLSSANQAITSAVMVFQIRQILKNLNEKLEEDIKKKNIREKKDNTDFKSNVLKEIHSKIILSLKLSINDNIATPLLKYSANQSIKNATAGTMKMFKNTIRRSDTQDAAKLIKKRKHFQEENASSEHIDYSKKIRKNLIKLKGTSNDPKVIAALSKMDLPIIQVEMEAAAQLLNVILVVSNYNIKHRIGNGEREIHIDFNDEQFDSSTVVNQETPSNDSFYRYLIGKIDVPMALEEFRDKVAEEILSNSEVELVIKNPSAKHFYNIGFYDAGENVKGKIINLIVLLIYKLYEF